MLAFSMFDAEFQVELGRLAKGQKKIVQPKRVEAMRGNLQKETRTDDLWFSSCFIVCQEGSGVQCQQCKTFPRPY